MSWLREEIAAGNIRWILTGGSMAGGPGGSAGGGIGGDTRTGSEEAITTVVKSCEEVPVGDYEATESGSEAGAVVSAEARNGRRRNVVPDALRLRLPEPGKSSVTLGRRATRTWRSIFATGWRRSVD